MDRLQHLVDDFIANGNSPRICVDSNIGGGKSTFLAKLKQSGIKGVELLFEPVSDWQNIISKETGDSYNILDEFYQDQEKNGYMFQTMTFITRMETHLKADSKSLVVGERSWFTDRHVFVEQMYRNKVLTDFQLACYDRWFHFWTQERLAGQINLDGIFFIDTPAKVCFMRKDQLRKRKEESSIPLSYLESLEERHHEWLLSNSLNGLESDKKYYVSKNNIPVYRVDGDIDFEHNEDDWNKIVGAFTDFLMSIKKLKEN